MLFQPWPADPSCKYLYTYCPSVYSAPCTKSPSKWQFFVGATGIFSNTIFGFTFIVALHIALTLIGIIIVVIGLVLVNKENHTKGKKKNSLKWIALLLASCLLNSISAIIDKKILMSITSSQLQFWFLLWGRLYDRPQRRRDDDMRLEQGSKRCEWRGCDKGNYEDCWW